MEESFRLKNINNKSDVVLQLDNLAFDGSATTTKAITEYDRDLHNYSEDDVIKLAEDLSMCEAVNFIKKSHVMGFHIKICENVESLGDDFYHLMEVVDTQRSILIIFDTPNNGSFIYWKLKGCDSFFNAKIEGGHDELVEFIKKFLVTSLKNGQNALLPSFNFNQKLIKIDIELYSMGDKHGLNLLSLAAKSGDNQTVKSLIKLGFDVQIAVDGRSAADFAYQEKHFGCLLELLKVNSLYPSDFKEESTSNEVKTFMKISTNLHSAIKAKNEEEVHEILTSNPTQRHFYDTENNSALTYALINRAFNIYEIFLLKNVRFGPKEDIDGIMDFIDEKSRKRLGKIHLKHSQGLIKKHLIILMANSSIGHDIKNDQEKLNAVTKAYNVLDKDHRLSMILKVVAATRKFQITFDFKRESVRFMDPTAEPYTNGLFYESGRILIGAKQLLEPEKEHIVYGVLAHELCHFAMFTVFKNMAKPYAEGDKKGEKLFESIAKECLGKVGIEEILDVVYECYPPEMQHAELIVRIPHMIGHYCNDEETLNERKITIGSLFNYFDEKPMKAMEKALPEIEEKAEKDIKGKYLKAERKISKMRKIILILVILLLFGLPFAAYSFAGPTKNWTDLSPEEKITVKNNNVSYHGVFVRFGDLFAEDSTAFEKLDAYKIDAALMNKPKSLNQAITQGLDNDIYLEWENSTKPLKEKILTSKINFQGEEIKLNEILNETSKSLYNFTTSEVQVMVTNKTLVIGSAFKPSYTFFVERNFTQDSAVVKRSKRETFDEESENLYSEYTQEKESDEGSGTFIPYQEQEESSGNFGVPEDFSSGDYSYSGEFSSEDYPTKDSLSKLPNYCVEGRVKNDPQYFNQNYKEMNTDGQLTKSMVINMTLNDRIFVLSDGPGSGKSTVFENLSVSIKATFPTYYVAFIRLKDYTKVYQKYLDKEFNELQDIADLVGDEILNLKSVESSIFKEMFLKGKVIFFWDALDEAGGDKYISFLINLISKIYGNSKNVQLISTRPEHSEALKNKLSIEIYHLVPYDRKNRREYLTELLSDISSDRQKLLMNKIQKFIDDSDSYFSEEERTVNNPLMLQLISEVMKDDEEIDLNNRFIIYQKFFDKKLRTITENHLKECASFGVDFLTIYQIYALKLIVPDSRKDERYDYDVTSLNIFQNEDLIDQKRAICQGILTFSSNSSLQFVHRTYAEYFVAKYLVDSIYNMRANPTESEVELRLKILFICIYEDEAVLDFLLNFFENEKTDEHNRTLNKIITELVTTKFKATLRHRTNNIVNSETDIHSEYEVIRRFFLPSTEVTKVLILNGENYENYENIADWMNQNFEIKLSSESDYLGYYAESHQVGNILYKIWHHFRVHQGSFSELVRRFTNLPASKEVFNQIRAAQTFVQFYDVVKDQLTLKDESEMFVKNYEQIFLTDLQKSPTLEYFLLRLINCSTETEVSTTLKGKNKKNENILHAILEITDLKSVEIMLEIIEKYLNNSDIEELIKTESYSDSFPIDNSCKNSNDKILTAYWRFVRKYLSKEQQKSHVMNHSQTREAPLRHCRKSVFDDIISDYEYLDFCTTRISYWTSGTPVQGIRWRLPW